MCPERLPDCLEQAKLQSLNLQRRVFGSQHANEIRRGPQGGSSEGQAGAAAGPSSCSSCPAPCAAQIGFNAVWRGGTAISRLGVAAIVSAGPHPGPPAAAGPCRGGEHVQSLAGGGGARRPLAAVLEGGGRAADALGLGGSRRRIQGAAPSAGGRKERCGGGSEAGGQAVRRWVLLLLRDAFWELLLPGMGIEILNFRDCLSVAVEYGLVGGRDCKGVHCIGRRCCMGVHCIGRQSLFPPGPAALPGLARVSQARTCCWWLYRGAQGRATPPCSHCQGGRGLWWRCC